MWWPIFVLFSPLWWILMVVECGWVFWCVEDEKPGAAFISIVIFSLVLLFFGDVNVFKYIMDNPQKIGNWALYYIGAGVIWAVVKYFFFLSKIKRQYLEYKQNYMKTRGLTEMNANTIAEMRAEYSYKEQSYDADFMKNKDRIITWMSYWPISFLWTFLRDFVVRIFEIVWDMTKAFFQSMHDRILKDIIEDDKIVKGKK